MSSFHSWHSVVFPWNSVEKVRWCLLAASTVVEVHVGEKCTHLKVGSSSGRNSLSSITQWDGADTAPIISQAMHLNSHTLI